MKTNYILLGAPLVLSSFFALSVEAADQSSKGTGVRSSAHSEEPAQADKASPRERRDGKTSGAVEDQLKACLSRIPKDSTAGQRMVAEQRCQGEQETRSSSHAAPKF